MTKDVVAIVAAASGSRGIGYQGQLVRTKNNNGSILRQ
jgi:hypothetical protein